MVGCWGHGSMYPIITTKQDFFLEYSIVLQAMTEVTVLRYTTDVIRQIMKEVPEISYEMIDHYCKFTNLFLYCITTQSFEPLTSRVCNILALYYQHFHDLLVPITQADLASLAGAKRESVVKVLRELREGGLIETHSGKFASWIWTRCSPTWRVLREGACRIRPVCSAGRLPSHPDYSNPYIT